MASQTKRKRKGSVNSENVVVGCLLSEESKVKEEPVNYAYTLCFEDEKLHDTASLALKEQPFEGPSGSHPEIIPADPSIVAALTSELHIKTDQSDEEKYTEEVEKELEQDLTDSSFNLWTIDSSSMIFIPYTKPQAFLLLLPKEPYLIFRLLIDNTLLDMIVKEINVRGKKYPCRWKNVSRSELLKFIGLILHTGTIRINRLSDYWKKHHLFNMSSFSKFMPRSRFMVLLKNLCFSNSCQGKNRLAKIEPIINRFNAKMKEMYQPGANLTVTESKVFPKYRSKTHYSSGLRLHVLAEPTGLVLKFNLTHGPVEREKVVLDLLHNEMDCGHTVYLGAQYNSVKLAATLLEKRTHCTGPLVKSCKDGHWNLEKIKTLDLMQTDLPHVSYYRDGIHICRVNSKFYVSTQHDEEMIHVPTKRGRMTVKPKTVAMYNSVMEEDTEEDLMSYYPCQANSLKWYKKMFFHVLHQAVLNAYYLNEKYNTTKMDFYNFRLDILENLLPDISALPKAYGKHVLTKISHLRVRERLHKGQLVQRWEVVRKECKGCKLKKRRRPTTLECRECESAPGFCVECFCEMHVNID